MHKAGGPYLELENILDTVEFLLKTAIDTDCQQGVPMRLSKVTKRDSARPAPESGRASSFVSPSSPGFHRSRWVARSIVPGRELLVGLILMARAEHTGGAEVGGASSSQSDWGLHPGADDRSSDEAGGADGARCDAKDRQGRHIGAEELDRVN